MGPERFPGRTSCVDAAPLFWGGGGHGLRAFAARQNPSRPAFGGFRLGGLGPLAVANSARAGAVGGCIVPTAIDSPKDQNSAHAKKLRPSVGTGKTRRVQMWSRRLGGARVGVHCWAMTSLQKQAYDRAFSCVRALGDSPGRRSSLLDSASASRPILMAALELRHPGSSVGTRRDCANCRNGRLPQGPRQVTTKELGKSQ